MVLSGAWKRACTDALVIGVVPWSTVAEMAIGSRGA